MNARTSLAVGAVVATVTVGTIAPAHAGSGDVVRRGDCSGRADWKVKVGPDDGRLEVEAEVDSNRAGQRWRWQLRQDGSLVASGTRRTGGTSGSFTVRRLVSNTAGPDRIVFTARHRVTGQTCRGVVTA